MVTSPPNPDTVWTYELRPAPATAPAPLVVSVADVCRLLTLSRASVWRLMDRGELPFVRLGGARRIRREDVEALVARNLTGGGRRG